MQLKVASYNIRQAVGLDWRRKPGRVLEVLNEVGADVVALQEVDRRFGSRVTALDPELIAAETDYQAIRFSHRPQSLGYHGNVILARKAMQVTAASPMILPHLSYLLAGLIPQARVKIYPDAAHGFLFQHHAEFARDVDEFLSR